MAKKKAASKKPTTKAVAKKPPSTVDIVAGLKKLAGAGSEEIGGDDIKTPMVYIAQTLSPAVDKKAEDSFIKGCEVGDYYNTVTRAFTSELPFIPCFYRVRVLEWTPRSAGGGLVKIHEGREVLGQSDGKTEKGQPMLGENLLSETAEFVGLADFGDGWEEVIFPLAGSGWNAAKTLNALMVKWQPNWWTVKGSPPPTFSRIYLFTTTRQENSDGVWQRAAVTPGEDLLNDPDTLTRARAFYELVKGGANVTGVRDDDGEQGVSDDDIPF